jgi:predicted Mrr-cat superfamily restriction endonuclease
MRGIKPVVFFNADGSTAIFEGGEDECKVKSWIESKISELKEQNFNLNPETFQQILDYIGPESSKEEQNVKEEKPKISEVKNDGLDSRKAEIINSLKNEKFTVAKLQEILIEILKVL